MSTIGGHSMCVARRGKWMSDRILLWTAGVANVVAHISSVMQAAGVQPGDRVLQWIAMYFDMTVLDFWTPLSLGLAIVVAPAEEMKDVERVAALVQQHQIASISMVPSMCQVSAALLGSHYRAPSLLHVHSTLWA